MGGQSREEPFKEKRSKMRLRLWSGHINTGVDRKGEDIQIGTAPGHGVVPALGEPPAIAIEDIPVVVEAEDGAPAPRS
jgi:hypothetical protein